jgi:signal transduction histidine kinase
MTMLSENPLRVLIIEDDPDWITLIRLCLEEPDSMGMSFTLDSAGTLEKGLSRLDSEPFDALFLDLHLPDSTGIETLLRVNERAPALPILVMTNLGTESLALEALRLGAQDYLIKSTSDSRLLKRSLWYAIERYRLRLQSEELMTRSADAMAVVDNAGNARYLNPAAASLLGSQAGKILGRPFPFSVVAGETRLVRVPGDEGRAAEMRATRIEWRGEPAVLACIRDVTARQKPETFKAEIQKDRETARLKGDLLATVSHGLRTPLTIVLGAMDNLAEGVFGPLNIEQMNALDRARRNAARLARMVDNSLDLSRLESGRARADLRPLELAPCLREAASRFEPAAGAKGLLLEAEIPSDLPEVMADPDLLAEVLDNLLDNALRFARTRVVLRAHGAIIEVINDGAPIPAERVNEIFDKFIQLSRPRSPGYKGTGMGLAICKEILALHGASIKVASSLDTGTCFHFTLPLPSREAIAPDPRLVLAQPS